MKKVNLFITVLIVILGSVSCNGQVKNQKNTQTVGSSEVSVYYFHFTRRCATCMAVEENARKAVEALYPNEVKTGEYTFSSLNLDETSTKEIADKLGVGGQSLLVVRGDKKIDITSAAWMAAHDPDKMKTEIKSGIDKVLF
jgi:hypothetical protein